VAEMCSRRLQNGWVRTEMTEVCSRWMRCSSVKSKLADMSSRFLRYAPIRSKVATTLGSEVTEVYSMCLRYARGG
jgi:hypothetical protein